MMSDSKLRASICAGLLAFAAIGGESRASTSNGGIVLGFNTTPENFIFVFTNGTGRSLPPCANVQYPTRWAIDISNDRGKMMLGVLMSAQALQSPVKIVGTSSCTPGWPGGDVENIDSIITNGL